MLVPQVERGVMEIFRKLYAIAKDVLKAGVSSFQMPKNGSGTRPRCVGLADHTFREANYGAT